MNSMDIVRKMAKMDAKRYVTAMNDYGKGSQIRRDQVKREINLRCKNKDYKRLFDEEIAQLSNEDIYKSIDRRHKINDGYMVAKRIYRFGKRVIRFMNQYGHIFDQFLGG